MYQKIPVTENMKSIYKTVGIFGKKYTFIFQVFEGVVGERNGFWFSLIEFGLVCLIQLEGNRS